MYYCKCTVFIFLMLMQLPAISQEVIGKTYPIVEDDFLAFIHSRLQTLEKQGKLDAFKKNAQDKTRQYVNKPSVARAIPRAVAPATRYFDPSIQVPYDINDADGRVLHRAGSTVNPLSSINLTRHLLFFNGNDPEQVAWAHDYAEKQNWRVKPILTEGSPVELMRSWKQQVFFDQQGSMVEKLGVQRVPTIVQQEGKLLRIDEVKL